MKEIRIELTDKNCNLIPIGVSSGTSAGTSGLPQLKPRFTLSRGSVAAYDTDRYAHPVASTSMYVPDSDIPLASAWAAGTTSALYPSDTFIKRMTDVVLGSYKEYTAQAARGGLFTSPFRAGCALQRSDGTLACRSDLTMLVPNSRPPLFVAHNPAYATNVFSALTEIYNNPMQLSVTTDPFVIDSQVLPGITHLVFFASRMTPLLNGAEKVGGIVSETVMGEHVKTWNYYRREAESILEEAYREKDFRILGRIPIVSAMKGLTDLRLPSGFTNLENWTSLTKPGDDCSLPDEEDQTYERLRIVTGPLDLGFPEQRKRVRGVTVRGIFNRESSTVALYGSDHRERWQRVATARGAHLRLLRGASYRWWMADLEVPGDSRIEALTFLVS